MKKAKKPLTDAQKAKRNEKARLKNAEKRQIKRVTAFLEVIQEVSPRTLEALRNKAYFRILDVVHMPNKTLRVKVLTPFNVYRWVLVDANSDMLGAISTWARNLLKNLDWSAGAKGYLANWHKYREWDVVLMSRTEKLPINPVKIRMR